MTVLWILLMAFIAACALGVVLSRSPITSAISLLVGFMGIAVLYLCLRAEFVAAVQLLVYAGGVMVLYIIGLMFTDSEVVRVTRQVHWQAWPAFFLVLTLFVWMGHKLYHSEYRATAPTQLIVATDDASYAAAKEKIKAEAAERAESNPVRIASVLFKDFLYPFEAASVLLTVAAVGGIFLAKKEV